jgi:hypothetical protein
MRRARLYIAIGFLGFLFLGISALLARGLTGAGTERSRVLDVLEAQARGDAGAVLAALPTLIVYIVSGRYFVRGLMAGAVKG